ncbi:MAG: Acinetobacter phage Ac42 [Bacteroidota bacterium]|jgi:group I intron endonuclease
MVIYKITNLINGKIYVGQDKFNNPKYLGSGFKLRRAIKKYGSENFKKDILESCSSKEELNSKEKFWIKELNSTNPDIGYNLVDGGQGGNLGEYANKKKSETLKKFLKENPTARKGEKNPRYDKTIYHFFNIETFEEYVGTKFDLANKIGSLSCHINAVINGRRNRHKNWILYKNKETYTKEFFLEEKRKRSREIRKNTLMKQK